MKLHTINRMLRLYSRMLTLTLAVQPSLYPFAYELRYVTPLGML